MLHPGSRRTCNATKFARSIVLAALVGVIAASSRAAPAESQPAALAPADATMLDQLFADGLLDPAGHRFVTFIGSKPRSTRRRVSNRNGMVRVPNPYTATDTRIERQFMAPNLYRVVSFDRQLNTGVTDTWQVTVSAVAKCNSSDVPYYLPNEHVCGELGRFLRLPVPPCALISAPDQDVTQWFASLDFNYLGNPLPPVAPQYVAEFLPDLSTGLLVYDILIGNCDRHTGNLSVDALTRPTRMFVFDQSHALFGYLANSAEQRFAELRDRLAISSGSRTGGNPHCLLSVLSVDTHFGKWIDRVRQIPDYLIEELCDDSASLGASRTEAVGAADFLKHRRDKMWDIIRSHQAAFTSIRQWSLFQ